ncbi:MAG: ABC transporter substrate-binding protein [Cyanobacteria bacterium RI_101]|nr:ABC transporter substrate-binding protein [Cyanobacteria bacterium RI_101]
MINWKTRSFLAPSLLRGLSLAALACSLGGCQTNPPSTPESLQSQGSTAAPQPELRVVTTFLPITQFTRAVAGERAEVTQLLPTNLGPHDYQAKPEDAQKLAKANVLVKNGLEMEDFLDGLVKNADNPSLRVIDSSEGVAVIETDSGGGHDHDHDHNHDKSENNSAQHSHQHGEHNPHIWLDPKRAVRQVENIRDGLIAADPEGKAIYTANAGAYIQQLRELDAETARRLAPYAGKTFVAFHDFAPYFAQSYNLKATFLVDVPEENPSPGDVKRVMDTVKETNLKTLLTEPQSGEDAFSALAKDLKVKVSVFDPLETGGPDALEPDYYLSAMRRNVDHLTTAFTGGSAQSFLPLWGPQLATARPQTVGLRF